MNLEQAVLLILFVAFCACVALLAVWGALEFAEAATRSGRLKHNRAKRTESEIKRIYDRP